MKITRRSTLTSTLFGAGFLGLRSLATGIPLAVLTRASTASADPPPACTAVNPQHLVLVTSGGGDPLNANVPGCYTNPGIYHPSDPQMAPMSMSLSGKTYTAAKPWAQLDPSILARTSFFHHATYTNAHGDHAKVNRLMGAVKRQEMLVSMLAQNLAPCLQSIQTQPAVISNDLITFAGGVQPILSPPNLQAVLASPKGALANLQKIRDQDVNRLNALFKSTGNTAQRAILDEYALSQTGARALSQQLLSDLSAISGTTRTDLNIAAAVLIKMNVSPVVVMSYSFGGDNHGDAGLASETSQTVASVAAIGDLMTRLGSYGLTDNVTVAFQNVFGRSLSVAAHSGNADGRNHNATHHTSVFIGKGFKGSVIGGVTPNASNADFRAQGIASASGLGDDGGDIPYEETLGAAGKTLGAAVGISAAVLDDQITSGKIVQPALA